MRNVLLGLHFLFAAVWLGCVLTEAIFERALLPLGETSRRTLAKLHVRVDQLIEVPAFVIVLVTGVLLWQQTTVMNKGFHIMLAAGSLAVMANIYCVWLVFARRKAAVAGEWEKFDVLDHRQHKFGAVVLLAIMVAICAGIWGRAA